MTLRKVAPGTEPLRGKPKPRACETCGKVFAPPKRHEVRFCSKPCVPKSAEHIAKLVTAARTSAKARGDAQRGRGQGKTYRKLNGRHEHRVVAEQKLGRPLQPGEVVHHIDGNHLNNSPENLEVMTQRQHMLRHGLGLPGVTPAHRPWERRW